MLRQGALRSGSTQVGLKWAWLPELRSESLRSAAHVSHSSGSWVTVPQYMLPLGNPGYQSSM